MKKIFPVLLAAGAFTLTGCVGNCSASSVESNLKSKGYTAEVMSYNEAKLRIVGLNYNIVDFSNAVYAEKGSGDNKDILLAFFFASIDDATKFTEFNNYENLGLMNDYGEKQLGDNLTKKVGAHQNVAYVGSQTSFNAAFN